MSGEVMNGEKDLLFLKEKVKEYYRMRGVEVIPDIEKREFAFFQFNSVSMHRGIGFRSIDGLHNYLMDRAPKHAYFSSAYYDNPALPIGQRKWLGADLIFDLDADHLRGGKEMSYEEMLKKVKDRFIYLIEEFILGDLGFDEKDLHIVFSGGRGYHLHIRRKDILHLRARERREIVDYITGRGIRLFEKRIASADKWKTMYDYLLPAPENGWRRRVRECFARVVRELNGMNEEAGVEYILRYTPGAKERTVKKVLEFFRGIDPLILDRDEPVSITASMDVDQEMEKIIKQILTGKIAVEVAGETDEPVTSDIKRVIRIPGSLHGGSGLIASTIQLNDLKGFDPLESCIPPTLGDSTMRIRWKKGMELRLRGERFAGGEGKEDDLPEWCAFVLIARGGVTLA